MTLHPGWPAVSGAATFLNIRSALTGTFARNAAGALRSGIIPSNVNAIVTSTGTMNVAVAEFKAVIDRFGAVLVSNDGSVNVAITAAPGAGSRWSIVYVKQRESAAPMSDGADGPVLDKVESTTSEATARGLLPAGALELAVVQVPAGASATNSVGVTITQTFLYTAMNGGVVWLRNATEQGAWAPASGSRAYRMDTKQTMVRDGPSWFASAPGHHAGSSPSAAAVTGISVPVGSLDVPAGMIVKTGMVVQGTSVAFGNEYFTAVTFPTAFPNNCLAVVITPLSGSPITNNTGNPIAIDTLSASTFRAFVPTSGSPWVRGFSWVAFGY